ncbi:PP2C family protein-serine/threonine phosphatase [Mesoterricola sediminis]|nr:protein phosphatase 2C domain-containing protein [Mesoterricola sediminis]
MLIDYAAITHVGRVRKNNEDAYLVSALDGDEPLVNGLAPMPSTCRAGILAAVADGMGGAAAGEIASREGLASVAVNLFSHWGRIPAEEATEPGLVQALRHSVEEASSAVLRYAASYRASRGMGSTLTAAVIWKGHAYLAQVGDSRAYVFRGGALVQATRDQTLVNDMVAQGTLTPEEARVHPQRNMITQALGAPIPIRAVLGRVPLRRGDRVLLCTDGLHGEVPDAVIAQLLGEHLPSGEALSALAEEALRRGGRDNLTGLLLSLDDPGLPAPAPGEGIRIERLAIPKPAGDPDVSSTQPLTPIIDRLGRIIRGKA